MERLNKINLSEAIYRQLLLMIDRGEIKPGDKLPPEPELCERLGASRTAIREGIKRLAGINVVAIVPGRGTYVHADPDIMVDSASLNITLDREVVKNIYEVRIILDGGIAKHAAIRAAEKDLEAIDTALDKMRRSIDSADPDLNLSLRGDEEFHLALCEAAHNKLLQKIAWPIINHGVLRNWRNAVPSRTIISSALEGHERIAAAIRRKDAQAAVAAMELHLKVIFDMLSAAQKPSRSC